MSYAGPATGLDARRARAPEIVGTLLGIKGQYLMFDTGVFNVRRHTSYHVERRARCGRAAGMRIARDDPRRSNGAVLMALR